MNIICSLTAGARISTRLARARFALVALGVFGIAVVLLGCARGPRVPPVQRSEQTDPYDKALQEAMVRQHLLRAQTGETGYEIGTEDIIEIDVFDYDKMDTIARVGPDGSISVPLLGKVQATGMTERQLEAVIEDRLRGRFIKEPNVTVFLKEANAGEVAIVGAVEKPGRYALLGQKFLIDLLSEAGGMTDKAGNTAYVIRFVKDSQGSSSDLPGGGIVNSAGNVPSSGTRSALRSESIAVDLDRLLLDGDASCNLPLIAGDLVNIPEAGAVHITGPGIKKPGTYDLTRFTKTLRQVVDEAEGRTFEASKDVVIVRKTKDKPPRYIFVNYKRILKGTQEDITLQAGDQIITRKLPVKGVLGSVGRFFKEVMHFGFGASYSIY